jgi:hypothetical protein
MRDPRLSPAKTERYEHRSLEVACDLGEPDAASPTGEWTRRTEEWADVKAGAIGTDLIPGGVRIWLPAELADVARDLARREAMCCGFLDIEVAGAAGRVRLDITTAARAVAPLIEFLSL